MLSDEPGVSNTIDNGDDGQATRQGHEDRVGRLHRHGQALRRQTHTQKAHKHRLVNKRTLTDSRTSANAMPSVIKSTSCAVIVNTITETYGIRLAVDRSD